jgi:beta-carotene 3-hydroxylase
MVILINIALVLVSFAAMEFVAWFTHKFVMHGLLWSLHNDHHRKTTYGFWERNDFFFLFFAIPGILLLFIGSRNGIADPRIWIGAGISLYGMAYFFVHDIFIHQRIKWFRNTNSIYLKALRKAHKVHHKHLGKFDGECFGMLVVPRKYIQEARQANRMNEA